MSRGSPTWNPTPERDWPKVGNRVVSQAGWTGTVEKILTNSRIPVAKVRWDKNGVLGSHTITTIRKLEEED